MRFFISQGFIILLVAIGWVVIDMLLYFKTGYSAMSKNFTMGMIFGMLISLGLVLLPEGWWIGHETKRQTK